MSVLLFILYVAGAICVARGFVIKGIVVTVILVFRDSTLLSVVVQALGQTVTCQCSILEETMETTSADSIATVQLVDEELHSYCEGEQVYSKLLHQF